MTIVHQRIKDIQTELESMDKIEITRADIELLILDYAGGSASTILNYLKLLQMKKVITTKPNTRGRTFVINKNKEFVQAQLDKKLVEEVKPNDTNSVN